MAASLVVLFVLGLLFTTVGEEGPKFGCELTPNNLRHAVQEVSDWQMLGLELGVPMTKLESLKRDPTLSYDVRKNEMLQMWRDNDLDASWEKLCEALDRMDKRRLAAMIRAKCVAERTTSRAYTEDHSDVPPTDCGTPNEDAVYKFPSPSVLAGTVGVLLITLLLYFGRGHIVVIVVTGIALMVVIAIYGMWSNPAHSYNHQQREALDEDHGTPDATTNLQKSLSHCRKGKEAPNNLPNLIGYFFGRSNSVQNITWQLIDKNTSGVRAVGIYGSPAVGKSTLAIHTAHEISQCGIEVRYIDLFDTYHLFEHHSESTQSVPLTPSPDPWTTSPVLFETPNDGKKARSLSAQGLLEWAKGVKKDALLVLDNCDNILGIEEHGQKLQELIVSILEQSTSTLRLIVTSRQKLIMPGLGFKPYYLRELDNDSAVQLLLKSNHLVSENDSKQIAALVDNNPLALHICADLVDEKYPPNRLIHVAELKDTPMDTLSADIIFPDSRKMVQVLNLSYKHLHNTTRSCGHYLSLFPGSFAEDAAIEVLSKSQFSNPKGCLRSLRDRSLIRPYELAGQLRYQHHRLVKEFFNYILKNGNDLEFDIVDQTFQTSFQWCYSGQLFYLVSAYTDKKSHDEIEEVIGMLEFDSHNFITLLELVAIHPPLSTESVYWTAHSLINSDLVLNIITEMELFRSLKAISHMLLYNNNEVIPILGNEMAGFWAEIFTRLNTIALSSTTFSECRALCMETFEFPNNVSSVIIDIMATEYYVPRFAMHFDWLVCWFGVSCMVNFTRWVDFAVVITVIFTFGSCITPEPLLTAILFLVMFLFVVISLILQLVLVRYLMLVCGLSVLMYQVSREPKYIQVFVALVVLLTYYISTVMSIGTLMMTTVEPVVMVGTSLAVLVIYLIKYLFWFLLYGCTNTYNE